MRARKVAALGLAASLWTAPAAARGLPLPPSGETLDRIERLSAPVRADFWCGAAFMRIAQLAVRPEEEEAFDRLAGEFLGEARKGLIAEGHPPEAFAEIGMAFGGMVMGDVPALSGLPGPEECLEAGGYPEGLLDEILAESGGWSGR